jgi:hypothetical protein
MSGAPSGTLTRLEEALRRFDEANAEDPRKIVVNDRERPAEVVYAERLTEWVLTLAPNASEVLRLAARSQHLRRWQIPRESFPATRAGYLRWREELKKFHAQQSGDILRRAGYPEETVARVQSLNLKHDFPHNPESRVLEDALCLVFLQHQLAPLAAETSREKVINALRKSWEKMTPAAREHALKMVYGPAEKDLLREALGSAG